MCCTRGAQALFVSLTLLLGLAGCQNQQAALSNPFLSPDRVPPPSTRVLTPGTAQPYYAGDPIPGVPGSSQPPAYTPAPNYNNPYNGGAPAYGTPGSTPPGGWNSYPQTAPQQTPYTPAPGYGVSPTSAEIPLGTADQLTQQQFGGQAITAGIDTIRVPEDQSRLRFEQTPSTPTVTTAQLTDDSILPTPPEPPTPYYQASNAVAYVPQSQEHLSPELGPARLRAVTPTSSEAFSNLNFNSNANLFTARDGFQPRGSSQNRGSLVSDTQPTSGSSLFAAHDAAERAAQEAATRFGMGPTYEWLRGQLVYSPESGQWRIVYMPAGSTPDQLGGSVAVANPQLLGQLSSGDFVMVRGQLYNLQNDQNAFAPVYQLSGVQRQRQ